MRKSAELGQFFCWVTTFTESLPLFKRFCSFWSSDLIFGICIFIVLSVLSVLLLIWWLKGIAFFTLLHYIEQNFIFIATIIPNKMQRMNEWMYIARTNDVSKLRVWPWSQNQIKKCPYCNNKQTNFMVMPIDTVNDSVDSCSFHLSLSLPLIISMALLLYSFGK